MKHTNGGEELVNAPQAINISDRPDVLVRDVAASGRPRALRATETQLVLVAPYTEPGNDAQRQALGRAAGSWPADYAEEFQKELRQPRDMPPEPTDGTLLFLNHSNPWEFYWKNEKRMSGNLGRWYETAATRLLAERDERQTYGETRT